MKKIAVYYPYFMGGGAEAVVLWMLQGLQEKYDLTLFTVGNIDFKKLNSMYGTSLYSQHVKVIPLVSDMFRDACYFMMANNKELRMLFFHLLIRLFKQNSHKYDLVMCGYNAMDLGKVGIQYIHMTQVLEGTPLYRKISSFSKEDMLKNISITNSEHLANYTKKVYGIKPKVVYPPVVIDTPNIPWSKKEDAFICSGRIVEAKEPHRVIKILKMVREKGFDIKLHMTGGGGGVYGWKYDSLIKKMVKENQDWITIYENLPYKEYTDLLAKCRYGIHFKKEPFGISIAEMVKAGAIPFVRGEGGQVEIVGKHNEELFFNKEEEAVTQIVNVLSNPTQQSKLCESLAQQKNLFSTHRFMSEFNEVVNSYFETVDG